MHRHESPLLRTARQADLDWDTPTSIFVALGLMAAVGIVAAGAILILDTLARWIGS